MTTLTDFYYENGFDDHLADHVNALIAASLRAEYRNVESLTATKELADSDTPFQNITASGANRTVELAPEATTNHPFVISNVGGSNNVVVKDDSGGTTFVTLLPGEWCLAISNGSNWSILEGRSTLKTYFDTLYTGGGASFWTAMPGTPVRASNTTFTITGDYTTGQPIGKGMIIKWTESGAIKIGMVSVPPTYSAPNTTITIIGDTMASIDASSLTYATVDPLHINFVVAGTIGATGADVSGAWYAKEPYRVLGADIEVGTAGTTNSTTVDINKGGTTMFTTKPTLASTVAASPTPFTADNGTSLALNDKVTLDVDAVQTTAAIDLYVTLYIFPTRYLYLT